MIEQFSNSETIRMQLSPVSHPKIGAGSLPAGQVALTFDDGPHRHYTNAIRTILQEANWQATFFQLGIQAAKFPDVALALAEAGHTIGSHTFHHLDLPRQSFARAQEEIQKGIEAVLGASRTITPFFRYPYGRSTEQLDEYLKQQKLISFFWDVDSRDWDIKDDAKLLGQIMDQVCAHKGGVILLHDIQAVTVKVLPNLIAELKRLGYTSVQFVAADY